MASLIPTTLLIAVGIYLTAAYLVPGDGCLVGLKVYKVGETFNKECQTCKCKKGDE